MLNIIYCILLYNCVNKILTYKTERGYSYVFAKFGRETYVIIEMFIYYSTASTKAELCRPDVRERIKRLSSTEYYIKMADKDTDVPVASFRKLNVD